MTSMATFSLAQKTKKFGSLLATPKDRTRKEPISPSMRKNAKLQPKEASRSTSANCQTLKLKLKVKLEASPMASSKFSEKMARHSPSCGVMLRTSGTRSERSRTQVKLPREPDRAELEELGRRSNTQAMHSFQLVSMTKLSMLIWATVSTASFPATTEQTISKWQTSSALESTSEDHMWSRSFNSCDRILCLMLRETLMQLKMYLSLVTVTL